MKEFACGLVVPGCTAVFHADDDEGIMVQVVEHALDHHGMTDVPAELVAQVRGQINVA